MRPIADKEFGTGPGGLPGNDDLGATSAWLVWADLGLYPMIPGPMCWYFAAQVSFVTVHLANGNTLTIVGEGAGSTAPYIHGVQLGESAWNDLGCATRIFLVERPASRWTTNPIKAGNAQPGSAASFGLMHH